MVVKFGASQTTPYGPMFGPKGCLLQDTCYIWCYNYVLQTRGHEVYIRTCHLSGNMMIATGMDSQSRGNDDAGLLLGYDIRKYIPLYLST